MAKVTINTEDGPKDFWRCVTVAGYAVHLTETPVPEGGTVRGRTLCGHGMVLRDEIRKRPKTRYVDCARCPSFTGEDLGPFHD
jgi:hypothetical protein